MWEGANVKFSQVWYYYLYFADAESDTGRISDLSENSKLLTDGVKTWIRKFGSKNLFSNSLLHKTFHKDRANEL